MEIHELYALHLVDGLPSIIDNKPVLYRTVRLRETCVADDRRAAEMAQRLMTVSGRPMLVMSDEAFQQAQTMLHIQAFEEPGLPPIDNNLLGLDIVGKLNRYDWQKIEERCWLIELANQQRYGLLTAAELAAILAEPNKTPPGAVGPRSDGQAEGLGADAAQPESGPVAIDIRAGATAAGASAGADQTTAQTATGNG